MKTITAKIIGRRTKGRGHLFPVVIVVHCLLTAIYCLSPALSFAAFETMDTGARQSGMGEAYAAIGGDIHSLLHNPAGLAYLNRIEFSSSYSKLFMGLDDKSNISSSQILYGQPLTARGSLGAGWMETKLDSIYKERTLSFGYGYSWKDNFAIGAVFKQLQIMEQAPEINYNDSGYVTSRADPVFANGNTAHGIGMDLGILYEPIEGYSLGLSLQNMNQPKVSLADSDRVPALTRFGISRRSSSFLIASEIRTEEFIRGRRDYQAILGAEKWWRPGKNSSFALRGSFTNGSRSLRQFTLGLGYRITDVQLDYSFLMPLTGISFGNTIGTHRISLSVRFGKAVSKKISWAMEKVQSGVELEKARQRTTQAEVAAQQLQDKVEKLEKELEEHKRAQAADRNIQDLEKQLRDLKKENEQAKQQKADEQAAETVQVKPEFGKIPTDTKKAQELFREGMRYYGGRQLEKAVQAFQKSLEFDPANEWVKKSLERTLTELGQEKAQQEPAANSGNAVAADKYPGIQYVIRKGDTLRSLAKEFYGDPAKWIAIRDANPKIKNPDALSEGIIIIIPQIPEIKVPVPEALP